MKNLYNLSILVITYNTSLFLSFWITYVRRGGFNENFSSLDLSQLEFFLILNLSLIAYSLFTNFLYKFQTPLFQNIIVFFTHTGSVIFYFWFIKFVNLSRLFLFLEVFLFLLFLILFTRVSERNRDEFFLTFDKELSEGNSYFYYTSIDNFPSDLLEKVSLFLKKGNLKGIILSENRNLELAFKDLIELSNFFGLNVYRVSNEKLKLLHRSTSLNNIIKNLLDIFLLLALGPISLLLIFIISIFVVLIDGRPLFYTQKRVGLNGKYFKIYKFRTMKQTGLKRSELESLNEKNKIVFKAKNDPRITKFGSFLRKSSLDELPQIINVLKNEMSFIGPRPPIIDEVKQYELKHLKRISVKPGITGLWQVTLRQDNNFDRWVEKDIEYIENWSLILDIKILFKTLSEIFFMTGE